MHIAVCQVDAVAGQERGVNVVCILLKAVRFPVMCAAASLALFRAVLAAAIEPQQRIQRRTEVGRNGRVAQLERRPYLVRVRQISVLHGKFKPHPHMERGVDGTAPAAHLHTYRQLLGQNVHDGRRRGAARRAARLGAVVCADWISAVRAVSCSRCLETSSRNSLNACRHSIMLVR